MTWEEKTEMIRLHNAGNIEGFVNYLTPFLDKEIDDQGWDMIITCLPLYKSEIEKYPSFYEKINTALKDKEENRGSFFSGLRHEYLKLLMEEIKSS